MSDEHKDRFLYIYRETIHRDGSAELLSWLEDSDFFTAPASTRFHGSHPGGLLEHSLNVYDCFLQELCAEGLTGAYTPENVSICALLHDVCKVNFYKKGTRNVKEDGRWVAKEVYEIDEKFPCGHGEKSVIILQNFLRLEPEEILAIRAHMGGWDDSVKGGARFIGNIFERSKFAALLHVADFKATYLKEA